MSSAQRVDLANDPLELLAVDAPSNESKGDADAASWLPPDRGYRCSYVARQIAVKRQYHLWVTAAEAAAMRRVLHACPTQTIPHEAGAVAVAVPATNPSSAPRSQLGTGTRIHACTTTSSGSCIRGGETCRRSDEGRTGTDAVGRSYQCRENDHNHHPHWEKP